MEQCTLIPVEAHFKTLELQFKMEEFGSKKHQQYKTLGSLTLFNNNFVSYNYINKQANFLPDPEELDQIQFIPIHSNAFFPLWNKTPALQQLANKSCKNECIP